MVQENPEYVEPVPSAGYFEEIIPDLATLNTLYPPSIDYLGILAIIKNPSYTSLYQCRWNGATYNWVEMLGGVTALSYEGTWDASTNTPVLADGTGSAGQFYVVSVAGSQDLGSGVIAFNVTDWVMHNGTVWQKVDNTAQVLSVFGRMGVVTAQSGDYIHSQIGSVDADDHHNEDHASRHLSGGADDLIAAGIESDIALNNLGEKDHTSLASVTSDQHHAQSHAHDGIDGSGTVAHSDTTGQGADDHHNEDHASRHLSGGADDLVAAGIESDLALNNLGEKNHASLASVSSDQHHAQSHAHNGSDGSGTVAHSDTTGQGADDHHNEDHAGRHSAGQPDQISHNNLGGLFGSADFYHLTQAQLVALQQRLAADQVQVVYFGKHGNDAWDGTQEEKAVLTIGQAIILATAMVPSGANQIVIECLDAGTYTESPSFPAYVHLEAPQIILVGDVTFVSGCMINIGSVIPTTTAAFNCSGDGDAWLSFKTVGVLFGAGMFGVFYTGGTGNLYVQFDSINGGALGFGNLGSGVVSVRGGRYFSDRANALGIGIITTGEIEAFINDIYCPNGTALYTRTSGRINAIVNHIDALVPWNVGSGSNLAVQVNEVSGGDPINNGQVDGIRSEPSIAQFYSSTQESVVAGTGSIAPNTWTRVPYDTAVLDRQSGAQIALDTVTNIGRFTLKPGLYRIKYMTTAWYGGNRNSFIRLYDVTNVAEIVGSFRHRKRDTPGVTTITIESEILIQPTVTTDYDIEYRCDGANNAQWGSGEAASVVPGGSTQNSGILIIERLNE